MKFNELISQTLHSLFTEHGLMISEQSHNIVRYESDELKISLSHDSREDSNVLWVGGKDFVGVEIDNQVLREHFNSDLKLSGLPNDMFVNNVFLFFMSDGKQLLEGSERALIGLEEFNHERSHNYTAKLEEKQNLDAANKAWKAGNYSDVIKYLDKINPDNLPESFRQKYKTSQQRLSQ